MGSLDGGGGGYAPETNLQLSQQPQGGGSTSSLGASAGGGGGPRRQSPYGRGRGPYNDGSRRGSYAPVGGRLDYTYAQPDTMPGLQQPAGGMPPGATPNDMAARKWAESQARNGGGSGGNMAWFTPGWQERSGYTAAQPPPQGAQIKMGLPPGGKPGAVPGTTYATPWVPTTPTRQTGDGGAPNWSPGQTYGNVAQAGGGAASPTTGGTNVATWTPPKTDNGSTPPILTNPDDTATI